MKRSKRKTILLIAALCLLAGIIRSALYLKSVAEYKQAVRTTSFDDISISDVSDGVYIGDYDVNFIYAKVEVAVQNGKITNIDILEHKNERGQPAEAVADKMIAEQKIDVDAVSGATNSSIVIKKAVENALEKGI